jgi:serine-type D-Ala-D-Ala carboxypeptidase/endopeptidase
MPSSLLKPTGLIRKSSLFAAMLLTFSVVAAQAAEPDIIGDWSGVLNTGRISLHTLLHVSRTSTGELSVALDSLDQGAIGLPGSNTVLKGNRFTFEIPSVSGTYVGTVSADSKTINGTWTQGTPLALVFEKIPTKAHKPADVVGEWNASVVMGGASQRTAMHVKADQAGHLSATLDSINDHVNGIVTKDVTLSGSTFSFNAPTIAASYRGLVADDNKTINGTLTGGGVPIPFVFNRYEGGPTPTAMPTPMPAPARHPLTLDELKTALDKELAPVLQNGLLSKASGGGGLVIGVLDHGKRRIFAYGTAKPDSIFEIGSITKTFTGLILAQMVVQKKVTLDEPIRALLPNGAVVKPAGPEITLLDLATQHSGLPRMPDNFKPKDPENPFADYGPPQLLEFISKHGVAKPDESPFLYSNLGFGLLGYGLAQRAGVPYAELLSRQILGPLHMSDTFVSLSTAQQARLIQAFDSRFNPVRAWDFDALAGAGAIKSTAADMLTYLDANLHPDKYAAGTPAGSPVTTLPAAVALDHQLRANIKLNGELKIALAWFFDTKTGSYSHGGGTGGYTSEVQFNPEHNLGIVTLYNRENLDIAAPRFAERVDENVFELMTGKPAIPVDYISQDERVVLIPPTFADSSIQGPYHCTLTAFALPSGNQDPFRPAATGDIHVLADGKGQLSSGTWVHHIHDAQAHLDLTCKLNLVSGSYSLGTNGTGTERSSWKLAIDQSPRACFQFFSPARPPVTTDSEIIVTDTTGKTNYSTSINPYAVLSTVCQREQRAVAVNQR